MNLNSYEYQKSYTSLHIDQPIYINTSSIYKGRKGNVIVQKASSYNYRFEDVISSVILVGL